jgi:hypothetical protein
MTHRWTWSGALASAVLAVMACSSASRSPASTDGGGDDAGFDTGATLPIRELNETGPPVPTGPVICSGKTCTAPSGGMIPLAACCLSDSTCGLTFDLSQFGGAIPGAGDAGLGCLDPSPGIPDPSCPSQSMAGFTMAGCCSKAGVCGVDLSMVSMGAIGCNAQLPFPGLVGGGQSMNAPPQPCGGSVGDASATPSDAGIPASDGSSSSGV